MRDRWTGWTAVTTPIRGRAMRASSAISPPTYIPISRTAASCSGPIRSSVSGRPTSLFWLPSLRSVRKRADRTAAIASLVDVLAMLPVTPDDERVEPAAPAGRQRAERRERLRDPDDGDVAERRRVRDGPGHEQGRSTTRHRVAEERVAVDVLAGQRHEHLARLDEPRVDRGAADGSIGPGEEPPAGEAGQVVGGEGGRRGLPRNRGRRIDVGHGLQCGTGRAHRSGCGVSGAGFAGSRSGVVMASVAMRRKSSNDITGISM